MASILPDMVRVVLMVTFPAGPWQTNGYVLAAGDDAGAECILVDPGVDAGPHVLAAVTEHRLAPVAIVLTHGHLDHIASAAALGQRYTVPTYLHPADDFMLTEPARGLGVGSEVLVAQVLGTTVLPLPPGLTPVADGDALSLAGLTLTALHAPGHSPGSTMFTFLLDGEPAVFGGDVLFAGSIGRVDLPGGDAATMTRTLASRVLALDDATRVLPGHGPATTIGRERATNPYLQRAFLHSADSDDPDPGAAHPALPHLEGLT